MSNRTSAYSIPPARKVSPLRQRMIDDMTMRNLAPNTMLCYLKQVNYLARYFGRSPQQLGPEEIREYLLYLARDRKVSVNSRLVAATALRFLYKVTLKPQERSGMGGKAIWSRKDSEGLLRRLTDPQA